MGMITSSTAIEIHHGDLSQNMYSDALSAGIVACDIETSGLNWEVDRIGTCQVATPERVAIVIVKQGAQPRYLSALLENPAVTKVFHHAPFDLRFMTHCWGVRSANIACTKIASKVLEPGLTSRDHSLKPVLKRHLNVDINKAQQVSDWLSSELTSDQLEYAAADVAHLIPLFSLLSEKCSVAGLSEYLEASFDYLPTRVMLDLRGSGDVFSY
jgi:ribonuclease D